jgi:hypothetical protein
MEHRIMKLTQYILGELLHAANSYPPMWRTDFYKIKDHILTNYAELEGHHLQHIFKECYNCDHGKIMKEVRMLGELIRMRAGTCSKCGGSGRYEEFWTVLASYCLGNRRFHLPIGDRIYSRSKVPDIKLMVNIDGYIRHQHPKYYLYAEAAYWLALIFDRKTFFRRFGHTGHPSRKFTPLVILSTWIFDTSMIRSRVGYKIADLKQKLTRLRQAHCRHHFPRKQVPYAWEPCEKCGLKRMYVGIDQDAVPF